MHLAAYCQQCRQILHISTVLDVASNQPLLCFSMAYIRGFAAAHNTLMTPPHRPGSSAPKPCILGGMCRTPTSCKAGTLGLEKQMLYQRLTIHSHHDHSSRVSFTMQQQQQVHAWRVALCDTCC